MGRAIDRNLLVVYNAWAPDTLAQNGTYRFETTCTAFPRRKTHVYTRPCSREQIDVNYL